MQHIDGQLLLSPTDLTKHLACAHVTTLDLQALGGRRDDRGDRRDDRRDRAAEQLRGRRVRRLGAENRGRELGIGELAGLVERLPGGLLQRLHR